MNKSREALHAWIEKHPRCHPVVCPRDPVKNTNKISIFYCFSGSSSQATVGVVAWMSRRHCEERSDVAIP
ncbi:MAG: hypothetical protein LN566_06985 [Rickettsia endosymbiont of Stiretrus anchorago]|nr:hypothetical protein [Rickettsia endosymbiont of Stiretrus anchorago]